VFGPAGNFTKITSPKQQSVYSKKPIHQNCLKEFTPHLAAAPRHSGAMQTASMTKACGHSVCGPPKNGRTRSTGNGKTTVELFSVAISVRV
jgi:hypothetical protein